MKDDSYYPAGTENPNVQNAMYWHDAANVLQDLDQFSELYVQFHSCAWSPSVYETSEPNEDDDSFETDQWYVDAMPQYGPNVAFSLYGILSGEKDTGCSKKTYINSFYTTSGFPVFASTLQSAGIANTGTKYSASCEKGFRLACYDNTGSSTFVMMNYNGKCKPENAYGASVPSALATFNKVLKNDAQCAKIYSSGASAPELLENSRVCSLGDFVGVCPDPYGLKTSYERQMNKLAIPSSFYHKQIMQGSILFGVGGLLFALVGAILHYGNTRFPLPLGFKYVKKPDAVKEKASKSTDKTRKSRKDRGSKKSKRSKKSQSFTDKHTDKVSSDNATSREDFEAIKEVGYQQLVDDVEEELVPDDGVYLASLAILEADEEVHYEHAHAHAHDPDPDPEHEHEHEHELPTIQQSLSPFSLKTIDPIQFSALEVVDDDGDDNVEDETADVYDDDDDEEEEEEYEYDAAADRTDSKEWDPSPYYDTSSGQSESEPISLIDVEMAASEPRPANLLRGWDTSFDADESVSSTCAIAPPFPSSAFPAISPPRDRSEVNDNEFAYESRLTTSRKLQRLVAMRRKQQGYRADA